MKAVVLGQADNGKAVDIKQGQTLSIQLPENPTTGFRWEIDSVNAGCSEGSEIIIIESSLYTPNPHTGLGGGGERSIVCKGRRIGTTQLNLKLWQSWEGNASIVERYSLTIRVDG